jgi:hypothetical protein
METGKIDNADMARRDWCLLAVAFLLFSASTIAWISMNKTPPSWDPADHIRFSYEYYKPLAELDLSGFVEAFFYKRHYYPPFYHLLIAGLFLITGPGIFAAAIANLLLLGALMAALYRLGCRLYSAEAGLMAALIAPTYHVNAALLHEGFVDFALMCCVAISLMLLVETQYFSRRGASIIFGLSLGIGMLCKQPFIIFLGLPTLYAILVSAYERRPSAIKNIALALSAAAVIGALWYAPHLKDIQEIYQINREGAVAEHEPPLLSYYSNLGYIYYLASQQLQLPLFTFFLIGLVISALRYRRERMLLYLCILSGLVVFTFIANKDIRYTVPLLPAVALVSTCWFGLLRARWLKGAIAAILITIGIVSFTQAQWPLEGEDIYFDAAYLRWVIFGRNYLNYDRQPNPDDWALPEILNIIGEQSGGQRGIVRVGMAPNLAQFNPSSFALHSLLYWNDCDKHPYIRTKWLINMWSWRQVKRCRYIIVRDPVEPDNSENRFEPSFTEWVVSHPERFVKVGESPLKSLNSRAIIYEQKFKLTEAVKNIE